jgi:hypothetical protein
MRFTIVRWIAAIRLRCGKRNVTAATAGVIAWEVCGDAAR